MSLKLFRCRRCGEVTANLGQVCWWCMDGKKRPTLTKADVALHGNPVTWDRLPVDEAQKAENKRLHEQRVTHHMIRIGMEQAARNGHRGQ